MGNPWTAFGSKRFDLIDPDPAAITLDTLARRLAKLPRWSGDAAPHYSVAEHEMRGTMIAAPHARGHFFCHDHAEAVWHDLPSPNKAALRLLDGGSDGVSAYDRAYAITDRAMHQAFGLEWPVPPEIKAEIERVDLIMLATERRDLMAEAGPDWGWTLPDPLPVRIVAVQDWRDARDQFCDMARQLHFLGDLPRLPDPHPRCFICGWPYASDPGRGCMPGDCAHRPEPRSDEGRRVERNRAQLRAWTAGNGCDR
jgi:hypothetical protein